MVAGGHLEAAWLRSVARDGQEEGPAGVAGVARKGRTVILLAHYLCEHVRRAYACARARADVGEGIATKIGTRIGGWVCVRLGMALRAQACKGKQKPFTA